MSWLQFATRSVIQCAFCQIAEASQGASLTRPATVLLLALLTLGPMAFIADAQTHEWTWIGGSDSSYSPGVYGTLGTPAAGNVPGSRDAATSWTDSSGNLWLFGGEGPDVNGQYGNLNNLWRFDPSTGEWTWVGGSNLVNCATTSGGNCGQPGVYGTLGVAATGNVPGSRIGALNWTDGSGNFWLFGGWGNDSKGQEGDINDLWKLDPTTNKWAWMGGSSTHGQPGVYGALGAPAAGNIPGSRDTAVTWTDSSGNFWLFGGYGYDSTSANWGTLNDLWEFNPLTKEWTWVGGSSTMICVGGNCGQPGIYGTLGTPATGNTPGGRYSANGWTDRNGNFWLFGGYGWDANGTGGDLDDLWEFNPSTKQWAWMGGSASITCANGFCGPKGVYGTLGTPAAGNIPGGRLGANGWIDKGGNFWLFGGNGFDAAGNRGRLDDLWEFSPSTNAWGWMGGSQTKDPTGVYGVLGTPASGNVPGGRHTASSWTDGSGNLWLFGGGGLDASSNSGDLNDLWKYQLAKATPSVTVAPSSSSMGTAQTLSVTAGVNGGVGTPVPTGTVTLTGGGYTSSAGTLASGSYTFAIPANSLSAGTDTLTVSYSGDSNYLATTGTASVTVASSVFSLAASAPAAVAAGAGGTSTVTATAANSYAGTVTITCAVTSFPSGAVDLPTCSNGSSTVTLTGTTTTGTTTVALSTTPATRAMALPRPGTGPGWAGAGGGAILGFLVFLSIPARRRGWRSMVGMLVMLVAMGCWTACGGGGGGSSSQGNPGTTPGTYTFTVSGTGSPSVTPIPTATFTMVVN